MLRIEHGATIMPSVRNEPDAIGRFGHDQMRLDREISQDFQ
jgi:hypothetical protein